MTAFDALIKNGHGLIRGANLYLHEVRFVMSATRAVFLRPIDILPGSRSPQYIVHYLPCRIRLFGYH